MNDDAKVVYSTEQGMLTKPMQKKDRGRKKQAPASPIRNPNKAGFRIRRESKGRGGKCVSVITGLSLHDNELKALLKRLKSQLVTVGTVKNNTIEIQGDKQDSLLLLLEKEGFKGK
ncbi:MAG: translation initiation factor, partial [Mariprofundaceae bacterium]|nr:translation initiation factor [Mariprofundaceae bacterium]